MDGVGWGMNAGSGWTPLNGSVTTEAGNVASTPDDAYPFSSAVAGVQQSVSSGYSTAKSMVFHPTVAQGLFLVAIVLIAYAWRSHLKSMLD